MLYCYRRGSFDAEVLNALHTAGIDPSIGLKYCQNDEDLYCAADENTTSDDSEILEFLPE